MEWLDADEENRRTFDRERAVFDALLLFAPFPEPRNAAPECVCAAWRAPRHASRPSSPWRSASAGGSSPTANAAGSN